MNLNRKIQDLLKSALQALDYPEVPVILEVPPEPHLGDRSCTVALVLAKKLHRNPREIAATIKENLPSTDFFARVEIAGAGYLNFFWSKQVLIRLLESILDLGPQYGSSSVGGGERRLFEYVSANPTGPMNIVSARAAAVGDSLVKLQRKIGFAADREYYVNDSGRQIRLLGASLRARAQQQCGHDARIPEGGYHGAYIKPLSREALDEFGDDLFEMSDEELGRWAADRIIEGQRRTLERYGVLFDRWFRESELYQDERHTSTLDKLRRAGYTYEKDGAVYFRSTEFGDDEDRVLITSEGRATYFLPDIAYHLDKYERGYKKAIDLLGPDHHGHGKRMQAAMRALGLPDDFLEIIIVQQVNLLRRGEPVKMSKRTGEMIMMEELISEVGADAAKQIFLSRRWSSHLDFDIEVAKDHSEKSPVYYVQYAHARICSIFRKAGNQESASREDLDRLEEEPELRLLRVLSLFPEVVEGAALQMAPHRVNGYLNDLATTFHQFYHECRVLSDNASLTRARLALCRATRIVIAEGLRLLGMNAPEKM